MSHEGAHGKDWTTHVFTPSELKDIASASNGDLELLDPEYIRAAFKAAEKQERTPKLRP